jgi:hypothetical protein
VDTQLRVGPPSLSHTTLRRAAPKVSPIFLLGCQLIELIRFFIIEILVIRW